jgi:hypothetical protein
MKYTGLREVQDEGSCVEREKVILPLDGRSIETFGLPKKIFKIGRLCEALDDSTRRLLAIAQEELNGDYVHFGGVFDDGIISGFSDAQKSEEELNCLLSFFRKIGLGSFVRLDLSYAPCDELGLVLIDESILKLMVFMDILTSDQPAEYWGSSLFEVVHSKPIDNTNFMESYAAIYKLLKGYADSIQVGLHSLDNNRRRDQDIFEERLISCVNNGCDPDFVTVTIDPTEKDLKERARFPLDYTRRCGIERIEGVWHTINDSGPKAINTYITESSDFLPVAVMAHGLMRYLDKIAGAAFWLDGSLVEPVFGEPENGLSGLFMNGTVRRPPYHLLKNVNKLRGKVLYHGDDIIVTRAGEGEYDIMVCNPSCYNREISVDENMTGQQSRNLEIVLTEMPPGRYRFEVFVFEETRVDILDKFRGGDFGNLGEWDIVENFENASAASVEVYERDVKDSSVICQNLGRNFVSLCVVKRIGE